MIWLDGARAAERHEYIAVAARHIVMVVELESLGVFDESGGTPSIETFTGSAPPPSG